MRIYKVYMIEINALGNAGKRKDPFVVGGLVCISRMERRWFGCGSDSFFREGST